LTFEETYAFDQVNISDTTLPLDWFFGNPKFRAHFFSFLQSEESHKHVPTHLNISAFCFNTERAGAV